MTPDAIGYYIIALTALVIVCASWAAYERQCRMLERAERQDVSLRATAAKAKAQEALRQNDLYDPPFLRQGKTK